MREIVKKGVLIILITVLLRVQYIAKAEEYKYDNLNRVTKVTYEDGSYVTYKYDSNGNILKITKSNPSETKNSEVIKNTLVILQKPTSITNDEASSILTNEPNIAPVTENTVSYTPPLFNKVASPLSGLPVYWSGDVGTASLIESEKNKKIIQKPCKMVLTEERIESVKKPQPQIDLFFDIPFLERENYYWVVGIYVYIILF